MKTKHIKGFNGECYMICTLASPFGRSTYVPDVWNYKARRYKTIQSALQALHDLRKLGHDFPAYNVQYYIAHYYNPTQQVEMYERHGIMPKVHYFCYRNAPVPFTYSRLDKIRKFQ